MSWEQQEENTTETDFSTETLKARKVHKTCFKSQKTTAANLEWENNQKNYVIIYGERKVCNDKKQAKEVDGQENNSIEDTGRNSSD